MPPTLATLAITSSSSSSSNSHRYTHNICRPQHKRHTPLGLQVLDRPQEDHGSLYRRVTKLRNKPAPLPVLTNQRLRSLRKVILFPIRYAFLMRSKDSNLTKHV
jgi:hypothetical protein